MTDLFSFVLVMVSLVLAIAVTRLVQGVTNLLRIRGCIRRDPLPLILSAKSLSGSSDLLVVAVGFAGFFFRFTPGAYGS